MNRKERRAELARLKHEASSMKSGLIAILNQVERCSRPEARRLSSVIARLEYWQNTGSPFDNQGD